jgi:magnesium chelatase family protein
MDELTEFRRSAIEGLPQPLEDGRIVVVRAMGAVEFPARFTALLRSPVPAPPWGGWDPPTETAVTQGCPCCRASCPWIGSDARLSVEPATPKDIDRVVARPWPGDRKTSTAPQESWSRRLARLWA